MNDFFGQPRHNGALTIREHKETEGCLALVDTSQVATALTDTPELTPLSWLSREEKQYLQRFRFPKRYNEWVSGRIAAKYCLLQTVKHRATRQQPDELSILPDIHGRPVLFGIQTGVSRKISISHSHRYAVAMTSNSPCGIDIQYIGAQILKVQDRIATHEEIVLAQHLQHGDRKSGLTLIWAIKEAVKKHRLSDQPGIFEAITIEQIRPEQGKNNFWRVQCRLNENKQSQTVKAVRLDNYMMAWSRG